MAELENLLLEAARNTSSSGKNRHSHSSSRRRRRGSYFDGGSDSRGDDSDDGRGYASRKPSGPQVPLKKRLLKSYFQTRNYDMGCAVWDEMIQKGFCPDDNSYTVLIGGLIRQGRSGEACKYLEEMVEKGMKPPQLDLKKFAADFSRAGKPDILEELAQKMKFSGKLEVSNVFARWAEMMKKRVKKRDPIENG